MLACRVLGPLELTVDETPVDLGGLLPRRLLTALVTAAGQAVPDDRLIELIWGSQPPAKAPAALQVYVSRLRGAFGPDGRGLLVRESVGYRLRLDPGAIDATRFADAVDAGRALLAGGRADQAVRVLAEALAMWRGEPYAELAESDLVDAARSRLAELREVAVEELAAARLSTGDATGAVAELEQLVRAAPLRERRWALLILGLYRCSRQGDALAAVRRVRAVLADELGVDPGPELQELERQVLAHDSHLDLPELPTPRPRITDRRSIRRPLTSFLGRDAELKLASERLNTERLVSLIGPAGVGKTRIAVEYAVASPEADGPWFARLADVRRSADVPSVVADAVGLIAAYDDPTTAVIRAVDDRPGLLVLDNCEHVVGAAAELASALAAACPNLRILATSREPLGVDGEVTLPIGPLPLATDDGMDGAAVALLVDRVGAVRPGWTPSAEELAQGRRVIAALDGLPLAIELAAARARVLGIGEIADRLDDRFTLLGRVPRGSLTAHATLEAAIGWSVDLLSDRDRSLLIRLWPFEGGFTLEAAEAVRPPERPDGDAGTLESLSSLVTRSVVVADTTTTPTRYLLLESLRAYARPLDPDPAGTCEAHARWVRRLADGCYLAMRGNRSGWYLRLAGRELPNIRAGLAHDLEHNPNLALQSAGRLGLFFTRGVHHAEDLRLLRAVRRAAPDGPALDRARTLITLIALNYFGSDISEASRLTLAAPALFAELSTDVDEPVDHAEVLFHLAFAAVECGHVGIALDATDQAIAISQQHGLDWLYRAVGTVRGVALVLRAHLADDEAAVIEAVRDIRQYSRGWPAAWSHAVLAETYLRHPGGPATATRRAADAVVALRVSFALFLKEEDTPYALGTLYVGALALARVGRPVDGVRLLTAVHRHARRLGVLAPTFFDPGTRWVDDAMADVLDPTQHAEAEVDGAGLTWRAMIALLTDD